MPSATAAIRRNFWLCLLLGALTLNLCTLAYLQYRLWNSTGNGLQTSAGMQVWGLTDLALEHQKLQTQLEQTLVRHDTPDDMAGLHLRYGILLARYRQSQQAISSNPSTPGPEVKQRLTQLQSLFEQGNRYFNSGLQAPAYNEQELTQLKHTMQATTPLVLELLEWSKREQSAHNAAQLGSIRSLAQLTGYGSLLLTLLTAGLGTLACRQDRELQSHKRELRHARHASDQTTQRDTLTHLINRPSFELALAQAWQETQITDTVHALLFVNLDRFKVVNDTGGHPAGDQLLREMAVLLTQPLSSRDVVARLDADEFGILLRNCPMDQARLLAQSLCQRVDSYRFRHADQRFHVTASMGLVTVHAGSKRVSDILQDAESACRLAHAEGGNRVHIYQPDESSLKQYRDQVDAVQKLQNAIDDDRLCLFWQRIVPLQNGEHEKIKGEVLLRLQENNQILPPGNFLPVAERFGLAGTLDRWVLNHVIDWVEQHLPALDHLDSLSVNLSGLSISDPAFQQFALQRLGHLNFPASKLILEVTETAAICNLQASLAFFNALRQLGIGISLDDFGSGMSSFGYLKHLPADYLKIDGQFMRQLVSNGVDQVTVRAICEVARATGKQTVAEWVDNAEVAAMLRRFGVDHGQGYFWHPPEPLDTLLTFRAFNPD